MTIASRIEFLETALGLRGDKPIIVFRIEPYERDDPAERARIEALKLGPRPLIILSDSAGAEFWENGKLTHGGFTDAAH